LGNGGSDVGLCPWFHLDLGLGDAGDNVDFGDLDVIILAAVLGEVSNGHYCRLKEGIRMTYISTF
jgi:hypothetical protein